MTYCLWEVAYDPLNTQDFAPPCMRKLCATVQMSWHSISAGGLPSMYGIGTTSFCCTSLYSLLYPSNEMRKSAFRFHVFNRTFTNRIHLPCGQKAVSPKLPFFYGNLGHVYIKFKCFCFSHGFRVSININ